MMAAAKCTNDFDSFRLLSAIAFQVIGHVLSESAISFSWASLFHPAIMCLAVVAQRKLSSHDVRIGASNR